MEKLNEKLFEVIHEDAGLLVINKPAGLVCHPTKGDPYSSLISRVRLHLGQNSAPHLVNRLDRETSGLVIVAKTSEAARCLRKTWEGRAVEKQYLAIVHGHPESDHGLISAPIAKDSQSEVAIKGAVVMTGALSETAFRVEKRFERNGKRFALLRVLPRTGRKHQIRIHLAHVGHPIAGDKLYGADEQIYLRFVKYAQTQADRDALIFANHALHAEQVNFHFNGTDFSFRAPPEEWFVSFAEMEL